MMGVTCSSFVMGVALQPARGVFQPLVHCQPQALTIVHLYVLDVLRGVQFFM